MLFGRDRRRHGRFRKLEEREMENGARVPVSANDNRDPRTANTLPGGARQTAVPGARPAAAPEKPAPQEPPKAQKPVEPPKAPEPPKEPPKTETPAGPAKDPEPPKKPEEPPKVPEPPKTQEPPKPQEPEKKPEPAKPQEPDWKDLYARLLADFDNFKKRTARDREDTYRYAEAEILKDILPAVDNLALALSNTKNNKDPFVKGVWLVYDTFLSALKEHGAEPFDSIGKPLDTERMEAIAQIPSETVAEGLVSNEVKRGWMLKDKVLRAAQVVMSAGPLNKPADSDAAQGS